MTLDEARALDAAERLAKDGVDVAVLHSPTIKPLDAETILAEAGVGKSRLTEEFLASVAGEALVLSGRCLPYGRGITFWALGEIVRQAAGVTDDDTPSLAVARLESVPEHFVLDVDGVAVVLASVLLGGDHDGA